MFRQNYSSVKNAICSVITSSGVGTGWIYRRPVTRSQRDNSIFVVTAAHVVFYLDKDDEDVYEEPEIFVSNVNNSGNNQIFKTKVVSVDKKGDMALLEIQNHRGINNKYPANWPSHRTLTVASSIPEIGIPIFIVGYPLSWDYNSFASGHLKENNASNEDTPTSLYYDFASYNGNSGSPVMNERNQVIGMLQWGVVNWEQLNGGIRCDILSRFIDKSITDFVSANRNSYNMSFKKNYIDIPNIGGFEPLNGEIISIYNQNELALAYKDGGRSVNGLLLKDNDNNVTTNVLERVTYIGIDNITRTIILSSSVFDKNSIWDIHYFGKPSSSVTLYFYNLQTNTESNTTITLGEMPSDKDLYLTSGFINKKSSSKRLTSHEIRKQIEMKSNQ